MSNMLTLNRYVEVDSAETYFTAPEQNRIPNRLIRGTALLTHYEEDTGLYQGINNNKTWNIDPEDIVQ